MKKTIYIGFSIALIGILLLSGCQKPLPISYQLQKKDGVWKCVKVKTDAIQFATLEQCIKAITNIETPTQQKSQEEINKDACLKTNGTWEKICFSDKEFTHSTKTTFENVAITGGAFSSIVGEPKTEILRIDQRGTIVGDINDNIRNCKFDETLFSTPEVFNGIIKIFKMDSVYQDLGIGLIKTQVEDKKISSIYPDPHIMCYEGKTYVGKKENIKNYLNFYCEKTSYRCNCLEGMYVRIGWEGCIDKTILQSIFG